MKQRFSIGIITWVLTFVCLSSIIPIVHSQILVDQWVEITRYYLSSKAEHKVTRMLSWPEWVVSGLKIYDFNLNGGTLTYHFGINPVGTNIIYQEQYVRNFTDYSVAVTRIEFYHNRYSTGGMQTNILSQGFGFIPTDDWLIGTRVRTADDIVRLTDKGMFSLWYINTNLAAPWGVHHMLHGSKGASFTNTVVIDGLSSDIYSPALSDFRNIAGGKNLTWAIEYDEEWFTPPPPPDDEFWTPRSTRKLRHR